MATAVPPGTFIPFTAHLYNDGVLPIVIAAHVTNILYGINIVQFYYVARLLIARREPNRFVWAVWTILLVAGLTDIIAKDHYVTVVSREAATGGLLGFATFVPKSVQIFLATDPIIVICTHVVYIRRIYKMSNTMDVLGTRNRSRKIVTMVALAVAALLSIAQIPFDALVIRVTTQPPDTWFPGATVVLAGFLASASVADIILCVVFIWNLRGHRTDFSRTNDLVSKWIRLSLECMILPTALQISRWVLVQVYPEYVDCKKAYHYTITYLITKLYTAAVLVLYATVLKPDGASGPSTSAGGGITSKSFGNTYPLRAAGTKEHVHVTTTVITQGDDQMRPIHLHSMSGDDSSAKEGYWKHDSPQYV
ncbi:hypothetical protein BT69DRAFT_1354427 [Atractiella rhizophila]|nr:hypothetical protein BT69DRAFT_1354427 [Atractiella rhizophila]